MKSELERKLTTYLAKIAPEEATSLEVIIKEEGSVNTESEGVKSIVMMIQNVYLTSNASAETVSKLRDLVIYLARALRETETIKKINKIWEGREFGIPVSRIEKTLALHEKQAGHRLTLVNGLPVQNKLMQRFTFNGKAYSLAELDENLKNCRHEIMGMFFELYFRYNIPPTSNFGVFSKDFGGVLPKL